ncbi:hypothetical protein PPERSA_01429 [Pseudocohnilembus persalinus]|uniref:diacylglycerol O-acyltransferase n=1 Tax=Pseudocohnilembus persalinus TaxID=266149 RepID=A0A0V0QH82_PSEPJ|nr:hypothetical protein PPERSA_01429 [Pseudocohnilembus persalinus]|eukprot:KRX01526.1 hypothetical protein PPERSA_01429 [Pseudocohnilembus persalinus]
MTEVKIKFYNLDILFFTNKIGTQDYLKEDFQDYYIKCDGHQAIILQNQNQILCKFYLDRLIYKHIEEKDSHQLQLFTGTDENKTLVLEIRSQSSRVIKDLKQQVKMRQRFIRYKGPLSYTPAVMPRTSLLSTESPIQNYRGFFNSNILNLTNILASCLVPLFQLRYHNVHPVVGTVMLGWSLVVFMKILSYTHVSKNIYYTAKRIRFLQKDKKNLDEFISKKEASIENLQLIQKFAGQPSSLLKFKDFIYFTCAPTLCFQLLYPRTPRIRKGWLLKRIVEFIMLLSLIGFIWLQQLEPELNSAYKYYQSQEISIFVLFHTMSKIAIPSTYIWICFFICYFHVFLNILSELTTYGDRQFYLAWWNCKDLEEYWRLWNLPVHNWLLRHIYNPLLKRGFNKIQSSFIVFFISAFFHEWIISGGFGVVEFHAFFGMLAQAPVIFIMKKINQYFNLEQSELGNVMFWISFCFIGQPLGLFIYYSIYQQLEVK